MTEYNVKELKSSGFMKQKEKDLFAVRLRIAGGYIQAEQLPKLAEISKKYGQGHLHLTTRQGVEIPFVHYDNLEKVRKELAEAGLEIGACGPRVRTVTACQGEICSHGLIEAQHLGKKIDETFFGRSGIPHKFKIGITGCPNACIKPVENDFGIMGVVRKTFIKEKCNYCRLCQELCPVGAIKVEENALHYDPAKCILCGDCIFACPSYAWEQEKAGYRIFVGGKMGKFPYLGREVFNFLEGEEKLLQLIEKTLEFYNEEGERGERFGETIVRVGLDNYKKTVTGK